MKNQLEQVDPNLPASLAQQANKVAQQEGEIEALKGENDSLR